MVAAALVALGLSAGAGLRLWTTARAVGAGEDVSGSAFRGATLSPKAAAMWARLLAALGLQGERPLTVARLVEILSGQKDDPLAQAFAADFVRDQRLMDLWDEWVRSPDALDAGWLPRKLSESREFAELLNKHAEDPRFPALGGAVALELEARAGQRGHQARAKPVAGTQAQRSRGPISGGEPVSSQPLDSREPGSLAKAPAGSDHGGAPANGGGEPGVRDVREIRRSPQEAGAHDVQKLKTVRAAGPDVDVAKFIESTFAGMEKSKRAKLVALCLEDNVCDPVEACDRAELYADCLEACANNPNCKVHFPPRPPAGGPGPAGSPPAPSNDDPYGACNSPGSWRHCFSEGSPGCQMCNNQGRWGVCSHIPDQQTACSHD